jgi:anaerobic magnesium-protoporphyrin IX monomethyl ester cyclase
MTINWGCNSRVDTIDDETMGMMKKSGLKKLHLGFEAGSERMLTEVYKKGTSIKQAEEAVYIARKHGIYILGFFIIGGPYETKTEVLQTIKLANSLNIDEVSFSIFNPLPGSEVYNNLKEKCNLSTIDFNAINYYSRASINLTNGISKKGIKFLQLYALSSFYIHPKHIKYILKHLSSVKGVRKLIMKVDRVLETKLSRFKFK